MWRPQIEALRPTHRLIVPDLRGFGDTPPGSGPLTMERASSEVLELVDELGVKQFALVGLSMGGYIAFALLARARQRIRALVLADTRAGADNAEGRRNRERAAAKALAKGSAAVAEEMLPKLLGSSSLARRKPLVRSLRSLIEKTDPRGIANAQLGMARRLDASDILAESCAPALVLVGEEDTLTPPAEAQRLATLLPNAKLVTIPAAGHLANLEQPVLFNEALASFLAN